MSFDVVLRNFFIAARAVILADLLKVHIVIVLIMLLIALADEGR